MKTGWKIVKKTLASLGVGALAAAGILIAGTVQPQAKAEAAYCHSGLTEFRVKNVSCPSYIRHFIVERGHEYQGNPAYRGKESVAPFCSPFITRYGVRAYHR